MASKTKKVHTSVLLDEVLEAMNLSSSEKEAYEKNPMSAAHAVKKFMVNLSEEDLMKLLMGEGKVLEDSSEESEEK